MKKIIILFTLIFAVVFAGCSSSNNLDCSDYENNAVWSTDLQNCICKEGKTECIDKPSKNDSITPGGDNVLDDFINDFKFNADLTTYEKDWLTYLEVKYPNSKIYHIKTQIQNCENCYILSYKKDREVIKIKIFNGDKTSETTVKDDIVTEIETTEVCSLFGGQWNNCPKLCSTDEVACQTQCGLPTCEFDYNKIVYRTEAETCGGLEFGDCEYGFKCFYKSSLDDFGVCVKK